ncbi:hypothetical protein AZI85_01425 [Bdellovibrio bacteriovorus]|uniref:Polyketide cyclase n=1 Tax=Bdellovibrio bacteriovorus TaxID=959 RepID=A0A150WVZ1_BDEBC|nr:SRPBCC family protein [Bdellovibrio bacteriovorus]KYG70623.1 hypothetical protein AZI85_01425 [Bdellovibrio bacteriovorus]
MLKAAGLAVLVLLVAFLGYVSTREGKFKYVRSDLIQAPKDKIYPYISDLKLGAQWSPYEKADPTMKKSFSGPEAGVGATMSFEGNDQSGSGKIEIVKLTPQETVELKLTMIKPMHAENLVTYTLTSEGDATRFTWSMEGDGGFMGKLVHVFIDVEKMVGDQFVQGIQNLKALVEAKN